MAEASLTPWQLPAPRETVAESIGTYTIGAVTVRDETPPDAPMKPYDYLAPPFAVETVPCHNAAVPLRASQIAGNIALSQ
ncbi:MAG TPA: hypothetical protein VJ836_02900 [Candidatus Saccharimonadales bacterium]|nr:hypothetical protein [Candidatus Saccharimonadales bacterium]